MLEAIESHVEGGQPEEPRIGDMSYMGGPPPEHGGFLQMPGDANMMEGHSGGMLTMPDGQPGMPMMGGLPGTCFGPEAGLGNGTWTLPAGIGHCGQGLRGGYRTSRDEGSPTWGHVALRERVSGGDTLGGTTGEWRDASRGTPD